MPKGYAVAGRPRPAHAAKPHRRFTPGRSATAFAPSRPGWAAAKQIGERDVQTSTAVDTGLSFPRGHYALSMAGILCRVGRLDAGRDRFRPVLAGAAAGADRAAGRQPDTGRYRPGRRLYQHGRAAGLGLWRLHVRHHRRLYRPGPHAGAQHPDLQRVHRAAGPRPPPFQLGIFRFFAGRRHRRRDHCRHPARRRGLCRDATAPEFSAS